QVHCTVWSFLHRRPFCTSVNPSSSTTGSVFEGICCGSLASPNNCGASSSSPSSSPSSSHSSSSSPSPPSSTTSRTSTLFPLAPSALRSHSLTVSSPAPQSPTTSAATASTLPSSIDAPNSSSRTWASISAT